jgi:hypothetical protein
VVPHFLELPQKFSWVNRDLYSFDSVLGWFDWSVKGRDEVIVDLRACRSANYQAMALLVLYVWWLRRNNERVDFAYEDDPGETSATTLWKRMGARGWSQVMYKPSEQFRGAPTKPLFAIRNREDASHVNERLSDYLKTFPGGYIDALRHVVSELIYNAVEHGQNSLSPKIPAIAQISWYRSRGELSFLIADLGPGIKAHLQAAAGPFETDLDAIRKAAEPNVSGTFGTASPYYTQNNAGLGLFVSSELARILSANLYVASGGGLLHFSADNVLGKTLSSKWPGTFALLNVKLSPTGPPLDFESEKARVLEKAAKANGSPESGTSSFVIWNHLGRFGDNKDEAIRFRDHHLLPNLRTGRIVRLDFRDMEQISHSSAHALFAAAVKELGVEVYRRIKLFNAKESIRSTVDFVFETNLDR